MKTIYLVVENAEEYSTLGGVSMNTQVPLAVFNSKDKAINYIKKNSKPQQINGFPPLEYGSLDLEKVVSNPTTPLTKLPNYKGAKDLED